MDKVAALREVKRVEEEVRELKEQAAREADKTLRDARKKADQIIADAREKADEQYQAGLEAAREDIANEAESVVKAGEEAAAKIRNAATGDRIDKAVDALMERFESKVTGN